MDARRIGGVDGAGFGAAIRRNNVNVVVAYRFSPSPHAIGTGARQARQNLAIM